MTRLEFIEALSNAHGVSGFEGQVNQVIRQYIGHEFDLREDAMGNLLIYQKTHKEGLKTVMLDGHSDEVGFMVQSIDENGLIRFLAMGGWFSQNVGAHKVKVLNKDGVYITGIVTSKPPHFTPESERGKVINIHDMRIDVGSCSYEETTGLYGIEPGAPVVPDVSFEYKAESQMMIGKAFDNRLGCALVVETLLALQGMDLEVNVVGAISTQEEIGTRGSVITSRKVNPDVAIVFEGTPADDPYRGKYQRQGALRGGPQLRHRDNSMVANPRLIKHAKAIAHAEGIAYQNAIRLGGGTDAGRIHLNHEGVATIVLGVPVRYAHTHYGISAYEDFNQTLRWSVALMKSFNEETISHL